MIKNGDHQLKRSITLKLLNHHIIVPFKLVMLNRYQQMTNSEIMHMNHQINRSNYAYEQMQSMFGVVPSTNTGLIDKWDISDITHQVAHPLFRSHDTKKNKQSMELMIFDIQKS